SLIVRELSTNRRVLCCSKEYRKEHGALSHPDEIQKHKCIVIYEDAEDGCIWAFRARNGRERDIRVSPYLVTNDGEVALSWAKEGRGIVLRSAWSVKDDLKSGNLVELLPDWSAPEAPIVAITGEVQGRTRRIQALLQFLEENLNL
ncbi:Transcriptional regulator, LysR family, partial [hydrothermal vent metagenome]